MTGYLDAGYAASLSALGEPVAMPRSGGWVLRRPISGSVRVDACGPYPFFACRDWRGLGADIAALDADIVSLTMVTDPFGDIDAESLGRAFSALCVPFKPHHVVDLEQPDGSVASHHRRNARHALAEMAVTEAPDPLAELDAWCALYDVLIARHDIHGPTRFSRAIFARQLAVPGARLLVARRDGEAIGMTFWYQQGDVAYYHLGAYSPLGYDLKASFALFWTARQLFRDRIRWLSLGAGAGLAQTDNGLDRFKRGWATGTRQTWLCGAVLDPPSYGALVSGRPATTYFPAYRAGEFA